MDLFKQYAVGPVQKTMLPALILEGPVQQTLKGPVKDCYIRLLQQSFKGFLSSRLHQHQRSRKLHTHSIHQHQRSRKLHTHSSSDFKEAAHTTFFRSQRDLLYPILSQKGPVMDSED